MNEARRLRCGVVAMAALVLCVPLVLCVRGGAQMADQIKVDFAVDAGPVTHLGSGMLQSISTTQPESKYIAPLAMHGWRLNGNKPEQYHVMPFDYYDRVKSFGTTNVYYELAAMGVPKPADRSKLAAWYQQREVLIAAIMKRAAAEKKNFTWEIWNEPNLKVKPWAKPNELDQAIFDDEADWFEVWDRTYRAVKAVDPKAKLYGPSYSAPDVAMMLRFVDHCIAAKTLPETINWHFGELWDYPAVVAAIQEKTKAAGYNVAFGAGESVHAGTDNNLDAGFPAYLFATAERLHMEMLHATWTSSPMAGDPQADAAEMAGLVTREKKIPRGAWWTYKTYGDMTGRLAAVSVTAESRSDGLASVDAAKKTATVLLGARKATGGPVDLQLVGLNAAGLVDTSDAAGSGHHWVHVVVEKIPGTEVDLPAPVLLSDRMLDAGKNGELKLPLQVGYRGALVVKLSAGSAPSGAQKAVGKVADDAFLWHHSPTLDVFEGEDMPIEASQAHTRETKLNHASGMAYSAVAFKQIGDKATYSFTLDRARTAQFWLRMLQDKNGAIVDVTLDGKRLCDPIDLRAEKHAMHEVRCGAMPVGVGKHAIAFTVAGKNEKSSGYEFGLDAIRLADVDQEVVLAVTPGVTAEGVTPNYDAVPDTKTVSVQPVKDSAGIHFALPAAVGPGKYHLTIGYALHPGGQRFDLLLDGEPVGLQRNSGGKTDEVKPGVDASDFGTIMITPGQHVLQFICADKKPLDSGFKVSGLVFTRYVE